MRSRRVCVALAMFVTVLGCSQATRVRVDGILSSSHGQQAMGRSLLQRQGAGRNHPNAAADGKTGLNHHQAGVTAGAAAAGAARPSNSQHGSVTARSNSNRPAASNRQVPVDRAGDARREAVNAGVARQSSAKRQNEANAAAASSRRSTRKGPDSLDFGAVPTLDLNSGLSNMKEDLSGLVDEFKQQGGFWKEGSLQDNISNMVQLGVKGALGLVSPIVNGITGGIPITVPSVNGRCLQGKPIHTTTTGLLGDKKRVTKCLIGTGSQVADYLSKAAGSLAGMAGEVLDRPKGPGPVPRADATQTDATGATEQTAPTAPGVDKAATVSNDAETGATAGQPAAQAGSTVTAPAAAASP